VSRRSAGPWHLPLEAAVFRTLTVYPMGYNGPMDWLGLIVTVAAIGGFIYIARSWSQGGDGGSCGSS
jgi:hypothetical protein